MKATDLIVVSRSRIKDRMDFCKRYIKEKKLKAGNSDFIRLTEEIQSYEFIISISRPLSPILEEAWTDGCQTGRHLEEKYHNKQKEQFLSIYK